MSANNTGSGQPLANTSSPLSNVAREYLKKNSNIGLHHTPALRGFGDNWTKIQKPAVTAGERQPQWVDSELTEARRSRLDPAQGAASSG
jgi:hypothetical protein